MKNKERETESSTLLQRKREKEHPLHNEAAFKCNFDAFQHIRIIIQRI